MYYSDIPRGCPLTYLKGCRLVFIPPYSPDFNPIEESFSCREPRVFFVFLQLLSLLTPYSVKSYIRRHYIRMQDHPYPEVALLEACHEAVTAENARGWFAHAGYKFL